MHSLVFSSTVCEPPVVQDYNATSSMLQNADHQKV